MFIHIGIEKTATTTLQEFLFSCHSEISYLGRPYRQELQDLMVAVYRHDTILYDAPRWAAVARAELDRVRVEGKIIGLSEEFLASWITHDLGLVATRLKQLFGTVKIVITIRRQIELLSSLYVDTIKARPYQQFESWLDNGLNVEKGGAFKLYDFESLAKYYELVFGEGSVGIFVFEEMVNDFEIFCRRLSAFLGIDAEEAIALMRGKHANTRKSGRLVKYKAWRSRFLPGIQFSSLVPAYVNHGFQAFIHRGCPAVVPVNTSAIRKIEAAYAASNRRLSEKYGLGLDRYGYAMS
ncbi:hypothetical protein EDC61_1121 [Sulfuritortus calidifontis]|uniref:Sulfotransferase domain-containing protein n=1 Tax=Sulfuritortus calidifontis TaxID=1914471 RepID=A0A4R3JTT0_9PROT|nr:hypothetical protein [Sulfuritortus calidifontis]TCS70986.1 hypothetical protein EDC61_1121 [Sulfuritortus calidifontis]